MKGVVLVFSVLAVAAAEVVITSKCNEVTEEICQIAEARISPCTIKDKACPIKKGTNSTLSFDYTPNFSASSLKTMVYWAGPNGDLPYSGMGSDNGCDYTPCPVEPGNPQQFNYNLYIGKKLPKGIFQLKWKFWNEADADQACCFLTTIKLIK